jgi:hypothetical protein
MPQKHRIVESEHVVYSFGKELIAQSIHVVAGTGAHRAKRLTTARSGQRLVQIATTPQRELWPEYSAGRSLGV